MKVKNKLNYESNVEQIKKNFYETKTNDNAGIINPLLLSNEYNPGILNYEPNEEIYLKKIVKSDFHKKTKSPEDIPKDEPKDLRLPINRNDVISLSNWLDFMIEAKMKEEKKPDLSVDTLNEELQIIYSACLTEITRQVSVECNERAILLTKVWTALIKIWETALQKKNDYLEEMQQVYLNEVRRIHQMYEKEIGIVKDENQKLENEKGVLKESNDILANNGMFLKNKCKKLEKDMRGTLEKFEEMKKEFRDREFFQKQMEHLLKKNKIQFDKDELYKESLKEQGTNLMNQGINYIKNENREIKYEEADIENNYDLDTLVFGSKGVDTDGLIPTRNDYTEITKDLNFMIDNNTSTKDLITFGDKQVQAKIKKVKKVIELDQQALIEQTRRYHGRYIDSDTSLMELLEEKIKEKPHLFNKFRKLESLKIQDKVDEDALIEQRKLQENRLKTSENIPKVQDDIFEIPKSSQGLRRKQNITIKKTKLSVSPSKSPRKSISVNKNITPIYSAQLKINSTKFTPRKSADMSGLTFKNKATEKTENFTATLKFTRHGSISEKSEESDNQSSKSKKSVHSTRVTKNIIHKKKTNSYSPIKIKTILKSDKKISLRKTSNNQTVPVKSQKNFENFIDFVKKKIFRKNDNESLLILEILGKFLVGDKLPMIFKEYFGKIVQPIIERFNELENLWKELKKKTDSIEIEKGTLKMQVFDLKNQKEILFDDNNKKNTNINILKNNIENLNSTLSNMQNEYNNLTKNFHHLLYEEDSK